MRTPARRRLSAVVGFLVGWSAAWLLLLDEQLVECHPDSPQLLHLLVPPLMTDP